jgi:hypothetical protein
LIQTSCALRRRYAPFRGGSDAAIPSRAARTTAKTWRGGLPAPVDARLETQSGSLQACNGCGDKIERDDREHVVNVHDAVTFRFHPECYRAWNAFAR